MHAGVFIANACQEGKEMVYLALGPASNLAFAQKLNRDIVHSFKRVFVCGGTDNYFGTAHYASDFNFHYDPDAMFLIFRRFPSIYVLPVETVFDFNVTPELVEKMRGHGSKI